MYITYKHSNIWSALAAIITVFFLFSSPSMAQKKDADNRCRQWAELGECDKNPGYMRTSCQTSCDYIDKKMGLENHKDIKNINSVFDLSAKDIDGKDFSFTNLSGKVTVIVNVASKCGYTENHYRGLVELWDEVKSTEKVEILAFPSNQFGAQEPGTCEQIKKFAVEEKGVDFRMMYKIDVNGPDAHKVYKYLKLQAGPMQIAWNFATYFVISPEGQVRSYSGVEPMALKELVFELLEKEL